MIEWSSPWSPKTELLLFQYQSQISSLKAASITHTHTHTHAHKHTHTHTYTPRHTQARNGRFYGPNVRSGVSLNWRRWRIFLLLLNSLDGKNTSNRARGKGTTCQWIGGGEGGGEEEEGAGGNGWKHAQTERRSQRNRRRRRGDSNGRYNTLCREAIGARYTASLVHPLRLLVFRLAPHRPSYPPVICLVTSVHPRVGVCTVFCLAPPCAFMAWGPRGILLGTSRCIHGLGTVG